ncbi:hypothetical protein [Paenibacillus favisporus]|uniref:hypothetical protein n=1 Tax=Paenibacillus favisporus TaxID=221028 RepID=UPI003D2BFA2D
MKDDGNKPVPFFELVTQGTGNGLKQHDLSGLIWHDEEMTFDSMYEAQGWALDEPYNKLGWEYDGYRTADPKIAGALVWELMKAKTAGYGRREVFADEQHVDKTTIYRVWVKWTRPEPGAIHSD